MLFEFSVVKRVSIYLCNKIGWMVNIQKCFQKDICLKKKIYALK